MISAARRQSGPVLTEDDVAYLVGTAARAPSVHNTQPWKFLAAGDVVELHADPDRMLPRLDPAGRELMISCGAALFGLRLAFRKLGLLPSAEILPDPDRPWLIARLRPGGRAGMTKAEAELLAAVPHRHTHRGPFVPGRVSPRLLAGLQAAAAAEGGELVLIEDPAIVAGLGRLTDRAAAGQRADAAVAEELRRWVPSGEGDVRDGVPAWARTAGTPRPAARGSRLDPAGQARRDEAGGQPRLPARDFGQPGSEPAGGAAPSATAALTTPGDTTQDWLWAGQGLQRLLLLAATRWVFASLQSQPLESPGYRRQVQELLGRSGQPQMLLQFGRANTAASTPRRQQAELRARPGL